MAPYKSIPSHHDNCKQRIIFNLTSRNKIKPKWPNFFNIELFPILFFEENWQKVALEITLVHFHPIAFFWYNVRQQPAAEKNSHIYMGSSGKVQIFIFKYDIHNFHIPSSFIKNSTLLSFLFRLFSIKIIIKSFVSLELNDVFHLNNNSITSWDNLNK